MEFCVKYIRSPGPFISMCKQVILSFTTFINQNVDYILEIFFFKKKSIVSADLYERFSLKICDYRSVSKSSWRFFKLFSVSKGGGSALSNKEVRWP